MKERKGREGVEGILGGLVDLVEKLGELAEKGEALTKTGEIRGDDLKGLYGFSVKVGLGGDKDKVKVEPFGNLHRDAKSGKTVVREIREPVVDVFEEEDCTLIVAEMPGIAETDLNLDVRDDVLTIEAAKGDKKYRKEVLLPKSYPREKMEVSCNNGIVEIRCRG